MRHIRFAPLLLVGLLASPLQAQEAPTETPVEEPGLMERGMQMFLRGLMDEVGPEIGQMQEALQGLAPELQKLIAMMGDVQNYHPPERQPNGDILIRRKADAPPVPSLPDDAPAQGPDAGIDL